MDAFQYAGWIFDYVNNILINFKFNFILLKRLDFYLNRRVSNLTIYYFFGNYKLQIID